MANIITDEIRTVIEGQVPFVATVAPDGTPNIGPKKSLRPWDDTTLVFSEATQGQTLANIQHGSKVAVAIVNATIPDGYRFLGTPEVTTEGEAWETLAKVYEGMGKPAPTYVVLLHIDEIFSLKPGPTAGKRL